MSSPPQNIGTKMTLVIGFISVIGNGLGATVVFIYFSFVESRLILAYKPELFVKWVGFFVVAMVFLMFIVVSIARRISLPLRRELNEEFHSAELPELRPMAGRLLHVPVAMTGLSFFGWFLAGFIFSFVSSALGLVPDASIQRTIRSLIGTWFVGAPITCIFVYFVLEWYVRRLAVKIFPSEALTEIPEYAGRASFIRISLQTKMLIVCLMIGTLPAAIISFITLSQINRIAGDPSFVTTFVDKMPFVILFLMGLTFCVAGGMSIAVARSIVDPTHRAIRAMRRIGKGDLDVSVPVVSTDEVGMMSAGFNDMVAGLKERDMIRHTFGAYVSEEIATEVLKESTALEWEGHLRDVTILVADLRGFTRLTATMAPSQILKVINRYLSSMTDVILRHGGTIDEFTGDGILVFFGAPRPLEEHTRRAVACALEMQKAMAPMNKVNLLESLPALQMGIGIDCGELVVGNIGSEKRKKYAAVGTPINVAFRVESHTAGGEILVSPSVSERLQNVLQISSQREAQLKGIDGAVTLYQVSNLL